MKITIPKVRHRRTRGLGAIKGNKPLIAVGLAGALIVGGMLPTAFAAGDPDAPTPTPRSSMVTPSSVTLTPGETWTGAKTVQTTKVPPKVDVMFVVDNTGSMTGPIKWAALGLQGAVQRLAAEGARDLQMGIVSYGDNDPTQDCGPGYGQGTTDWFVNEAPLGSTNTAGLVSKFEQISKQVSEGYYCNGLDAAESTFSAVAKVATETKWRDHAARYVINVTDAPWKIQNNVMVGGKYASNVSGLIKALEDSDVYLEVQGVNCWSGRCLAINQPVGNLPAISGKDVTAAVNAALTDPGKKVLYAESEDDKELNNNIVVSTLGVNPSWDITHETKCVYDSDGAPSTDIAVSLNPAKVSVATGDSARFDEVATGTTTPGRYDDKTVCTTQFFIDGNDAGADYRQTVEMTVADPGQFLITKTAQPPSGTNVMPGSTVTYTVTAENTTKKAITGGTFTDDLSEILDDADVAASSIKVVGPGKAELKGDKIIWNGDLAPNEKATVSYEAVVPYPVKAGGNLTLKNNVSSDTGLSTCPAGSTDPECNTTHPISGFMLNKTSDNANPVLGDKVTFTITGQNVSNGPLTTSFSDSLADILDDANYNGDITSSVPVADVSGDTLTWAGTLAPMETVVVTYSVTIKADSAVTGNGILTNKVESQEPTNCVVGDPNPPPECAIPPTPIGGITVVKTSEAGQEVLPGDTIKYTVVATNTGQVDLDPASFKDDMSDVLDDATFMNDIKISPAANGKAELKGDILTWTGALKKGESVTLTYSVKIDNPPAGNKSIKNVVLGPGTNCDVDPTLPGCSKITPVPALDVAKVVIGSPSTVYPGDRVTYKLVATNTGETDLVGANEVVLTDDLTGVLDDATFDINDVVVTAPNAGKVELNGNVLSWKGPLFKGERVEVLYTVVVKDTLGDHNLSNKVVSEVVGSTCAPGSTSPSCSTSTEAASIRISKSASPVGVVAPGKPVIYTVTIVNDSKGDAKNIKVTDDLTQVVDDARLDQTTLNSDLGAKPTYDTTTRSINWTGDIPAGKTVTLTYTAVANYPSTGDLNMRNSVISENDGSTCKPGNSNPECGTSTEVAGDVVKKTHDIPPGTAVRPGSKVTYTVTVLNNSNTATTGSNFTDDMSGVLDDATYNNDAAVTPNTLPVPVFDASAQTMSWVGPLNPGQTATITYSVTVNDPRTGDGQLINTLTDGGICEENDPNPPEWCKPPPPVVGGFIIKKTSDVTGKARPGSDVTYTITGENIGDGKISNAKFEDNLSKILDDAQFDSKTLTASTGSATYDIGTQTITWTGDLDPKQIVTVTYTVKVDDPGTGDKQMANTVVSDTDGTNCPPGSDDPACTSTSEVGGFTIKKTSDAAAGAVVKPGTVVNFTVTAHNNTLHDVANASFVDDLSDVLDDATFNDGSIVVVPSGTSAVLDPTAKTLTWNGPLNAGQTAKVTYSVTIGKNMGGNHNLKNGVSSMEENTNCPPNSTDPDCSTSNETAGFNVSKTADTPSGTAVARDQLVTYTVVAHNDSENAMTGASWTDDLSNVLDDAALVDGPTIVSGGGKVSIDKNNIVTWTGDLAAGERVTVTYKVRVKDHGVTAGDNSLVNSIKTEGDLGSCPPGNTDPECVVVLPVEGLTISKTSSIPTGSPVAAGQDVTYTVKVANTGNTKITGATFEDDMTKVLNAAVLDESGLNNAATIGKVTFDSSTKILSWVGDLDLGQEAIVTYTVTVNTDGHSSQSALINKVTSDIPGTNCPPGNNDPLCENIIEISAVHVSKAVSTDQNVVVGEQVVYTVTVKNTGALDLTGIYIEDDLTDVLDDGWVVRNSWGQSSGLASYTQLAKELTWTGDLKIGESATFWYTIEVSEPQQSMGNKTMINRVVGGSNCLATSTDPVCTTSTKVQAIIWVLSNDKGSGTNVAPGSTINYKIEALNWGASDELNMDYKVDLAGVLDDAVIDESSIKVDVRNSAPGVPHSTKEPVFDANAGTLTWNGDLYHGEEFDVTFQAVVKDQPDGDRALVAKLASSAYGTNCPVNSTDARCTLANPVDGINLSVTSDIDPAIGFAQAGQTVNYTAEMTNNTGLDFAGSFSYDLSKLLDDADIVGDISTTTTPAVQGATFSVAKLNGAGIDWSGGLANGETVTVKFAAQVKVAGTGDRVLDTSVVSPSAGTNCAIGSSDPSCVTSDLVREINFSKTVDKTGVVKSGDVVTYTVKINNIGKIDYVDVQFADNLSEVLDDATFQSVTQDAGTAVYNAPVISWKGDLAAGQSASITYSVKIKDGRPGDGVLFNRVTSGLPDTNCPAGSTDPACSTVTKIDPLVKVGPIALPVTGIELGRIVTGIGLALLLGAGALLIARLRTVSDEEA